MRRVLGHVLEPPPKQGQFCPRPKPQLRGDSTLPNGAPPRLHDTRAPRLGSSYTAQKYPQKHIC